MVTGRSHVLLVLSGTPGMLSLISALTVVQCKDHVRGAGGVQAQRAGQVHTGCSTKPRMRTKMKSHRWEHSLRLSQALLPVRSSPGTGVLPSAPWLSEWGSPQQSSFLAFNCSLCSSWPLKDHLAQWNHPSFSVTVEDIFFSWSSRRYRRLQRCSMEPWSSSTNQSLSLAAAPSASTARVSLCFPRKSTSVCCKCCKLVNVCKVLWSCEVLHNYYVLSI